MSLRKTGFVICLVLSVLCLVAGYGIAGRWIEAGMAVLLGPAWVIARRYPGSWLPFFCILGSVGLATAGILTGTPPVLMIFGSALTLAVWDLVALDSALGTHSLMKQTRRYEKAHLRSLALAIGGALLATLLGRLLAVQLPFIVLQFSITFILFALDRVWRLIKRAGKA